MGGITGIIQLVERIATNLEQSRFVAMADSISYRKKTKAYLYENENSLLCSFDTEVWKGGEEYNNIDIVIDGFIFNTDEIYNKAQKKRASVSINELICSLYIEQGTEFSKLLNGQFVIIIVDKARNQVHVIRDHLGIKPIYYYKKGQKILLGSEIKSLIANPEIRCSFNLDRALGMGWDTTMNDYETYYDSIFLVPEGSVLTIEISTGNIRNKRYWEITPNAKDIYEQDSRSRDEIIGQYKQLVESSVKLRADNSQTAMLFLSGGLDSSTIAACLRKNNIELQCFSTFTRQAYRKGDSYRCYDLSQRLDFSVCYSALSYEKLSTLTAHDWKSILWYCENPHIDLVLLIKYFTHKYVHSLNKKGSVIFTGVGSDEYNGGSARSSIPLDQVDNIDHWEVFYSKLQEREFNYYIEKRTAGLKSYFPFIKKSYLSQLTDKPLYSNAWHFYINAHKYNFNLKHLWPEERAAAANGNDNIYPFLDYRIIDFVAKVPSRYYSTLFYDKRILRDAMKAELGEIITANPKVEPPVNASEDKTGKLFFDIFTSNNNELWEEALNNIDDFVDIKLMYWLLNNLRNSGNYSIMRHVLPILNCGLLISIRKNGFRPNEIKYTPSGLCDGSWPEIETFIKEKLYL